LVGLDTVLVTCALLMLASVPALLTVRTVRAG
jgi:hypothetical protein